MTQIHTTFIRGKQAEMTKLKRHTPETIEALIVAEQYHQFPGTNITVCILKLKNGHTVLSYSACVHDVDFDIDKGRAAARVKAVPEVWALEAYLESNRQHLLGNTSEGQPLTEEPTELDLSGDCGV